MLNDLFHWYVTMLRATAPRALGARLAGAQRGIVVSASPCGHADEAMVSAMKGGREHRLGRLGVLLAEGRLPQGQQATIRLPRGASILEREATLPLAVERNLDTALGHEIDRLTPFNAAEVVWHAAVLRRDREAGMLRLGLAILPRRRIGDLLDRLALGRLTVVAVEGETGTGRRTIPLDDSVRHARHGARLLAYACAVLALACLLIPPIRQQIALGRQDAAMAALAPALHRAEAIRTRLAGDATGQKALAAKGREQSAALRALAEITRALPDGSFLTDLALRDGAATLDGLSPDAARLIARFATDPDFADPAFTAPVTRSLDAKADLFAMRVRLRASGGRS